MQDIYNKKTVPGGFVRFFLRESMKKYQIEKTNDLIVVETIFF